MDRRDFVKTIGVSGLMLPLTGNLSLDSLKEKEKNIIEILETGNLICPILSYEHDAVKVRIYLFGINDSEFNFKLTTDILNDCVEKTSFSTKSVVFSNFNDQEYCYCFTPRSLKLINDAIYLEGIFCNYLKGMFCNYRDTNEFPLLLESIKNNEWKINYYSTSIEHGGSIELILRDFNVEHIRS